MKKIWNKLPDGLRRVLHTLWQVALGTLIAHWTIPHSSKDVVGLLSVVYASVLAAAKNLIVTSQA